MTPTQILDASKNNLNAGSDSFWSESELLMSLYRVEMDLALRTRCIETIYTTTTTSSTAEYTKPTRAIEILRVTYNGAKLQRIDLREYDSINPNSTTSSGTPAYYLYFDDTITLYPTPNDTQTVKIWSLDEPSVPTISSTLDIPSQYHHVLVDGLTKEMCPKDLGHPLTAYWAGKYLDGVKWVQSHIRLSKRADRFTVVKTEEQMLATEFGVL